MSNDLSWRVLGRVCDDTNDGLLPHPARSSEIAWRSASGPKPEAADFDVGFCFAPKAATPSHIPLPTIIPRERYSGTMPGWFGRRVMTSISRLRYAARREGERSRADGLRIRLGIHNLSGDQIIAFSESYRQMQAISDNPG